jgi:FtsP/CotA-like multicopper oxidase with cupredoxin domain
MHKLLVRGLLAVVVAASSLLASAQAQSPRTAPNLAVRPDFKEPVTLATKDGILEVRLTARQGEATLDTVATPVRNFLLFDYELIRGAASDGKKSGKNLYPAPTLQVFPGEKLIVHFDNSLSGLTIRDYYNPQYMAKGQPAPLYPEQLTSSPLNLHTHGLHVSPKGNADNVMLHIPAGMSNTYIYDVPKNMPHGAYWYHSHLHTLTAPQTFLGLAGPCSRSEGPTATSRSSRKSAFRSGTCCCSTTAFLSARAVSPNSTTSTGPSMSARSSHPRATSWRKAPIVR